MKSPEYPGNRTILIGWDNQIHSLGQGKRLRDTPEHTATMYLNQTQFCAKEEVTTVPSKVTLRYRLCKAWACHNRGPEVGQSWAGQEPPNSYQEILTMAAVHF